MCQHFLQGTKLIEECCGFLRPYQGNSWHVIDGISHERLKIDHLIGTNAPVGQQFCFTERCIFTQIEKFHLRPEQLAGIFIAGHDAHIRATFHCFMSE